MQETTPSSFSMTSLHRGPEPLATDMSSERGQDADVVACREISDQPVVAKHRPGDGYVGARRFDDRRAGVAECLAQRVVALTAPRGEALIQATAFSQMDPGWSAPMAQHRRRTVPAYRVEADDLLTDVVALPKLIGLRSINLP